MATIRPATIGGRTCTPARAAMSPISEGKMAAPAWAVKNIRPREGERVSWGSWEEGGEERTECGGLDGGGEEFRCYRYALDYDR